MPPLPALVLFDVEISFEFVVWAGFTLLLAAAIGFSAGVWYERTAVKRAVNKARRVLSRMLEVVVERIDAAQQACDMLADFPELALTADQTEKLDSRRQALLSTMDRIVDQQRALVAAVGDVTAGPPEPPPFELTWVREPQDAGTGLPDRTALEFNLQAMIAAGTAAGCSSGLLLVRIDKLDQLQNRFGVEGAKVLIRKVSAVICRASRDADLLCRYNTDTFALLIPDVSDDAGRTHAQAVRDAIRNYAFRLDEVGPEVLVTASFGYAMCRPGEDAELALNRAGSAVSKSQSRGRNQLHTHDGAGLVHCLAG